MEDKLYALKENHTKDLIPRPIDALMIGNKWVYKIKMKLDGTLDRHKTSLVSQRY